MNTTKILQILPKLSNSDLLKIAQEALRQTQQDHKTLTEEEIKQQWSIAATEALKDYTFDQELTAFTVLDSEPFYAYNSQENE